MNLCRTARKPRKSAADFYAFGGLLAEREGFEKVM
jgi:hypothetical protein